MTRTHNIGRLSADELAEFDDIKADLEALTGRMSRPDCVMKIARWVKRDMQAGRHYSDDVPSIMEAVAPEPIEVLSNCWHCKHNRIHLDSSSCLRGLDSLGMDADVEFWTSQHCLGDKDMPPRNATGCPGFEPKDQP